MDVIAEIIRLFRERGDTAYFGEQVSQREHALQAAALAEAEGAANTLIVAALLHDIGHLLHSLPENSADQGIDTGHEQIGDRWLRRHFGPAVTEPTRLHVAAKRYLCAVDAAYAAHLSAASRQSLALQGGPYDPAECTTFEQNPFFRDAVRLRRWDDEAKRENWPTPSVEHYRPHLAAALLQGSNEEKAENALLS